MTEERVHIRVWGRVQGVGFRSFVASAARPLGLTGWVRNVGRDQVEVVAEGRRTVLEKFTETIEAGPNVSRVDESQITWSEASGEFNNFSVRWF